MVPTGFRNQKSRLKVNIETNKKPTSLKGSRHLKD